MIAAGASWGKTCFHCCLTVEKDFFCKVSVFYGDSILAFVRGIRVRGRAFCPTACRKGKQKGASPNCWQWRPNFSTLATQTQLKFSWTLSVVLPGRGVILFNTETKSEQEGRDRGAREGRHCSLPPAPCTLTDKSAHLFSYVFLCWLFPQETCFSLLFLQSLFPAVLSNSPLPTGTFPRFSLLTFSPLCLGPKARSKLPDSF